MLAYNCIEWVEIYAAAAKSGLVAVPINFRTGRSRSAIHRRGRRRLRPDRSGRPGIMKSTRSGRTCPSRPATMSISARPSCPGRLPCIRGFDRSRQRPRGCRPREAGRSLDAHVYVRHDRKPQGSHPEPPGDGDAGAHDSKWNWAFSGVTRPCSSCRSAMPTPSISSAPSPISAPPYRSSRAGASIRFYACEP